MILTNNFSFISILCTLVIIKTSKNITNLEVSTNTPCIPNDKKFWLLKIHSFFMYLDKVSFRCIAKSMNLQSII